jgi:hypothetical protein
VQLALLVSVTALALGTALGLARDEWGRAVHGFHVVALLAAAAVGLGRLLPEAFQALGAAALAVFAAAFALPMLAQGLAARLPQQGGGGGRLGLELSYVGLLVHKLADGAALNTYACLGQVDVVLAIAAHTVPVTAVIVMVFSDRSGIRSGARRALGLLVATLLGIGAAELIGLDVVRQSSPWIDAAVGGLLLHVVAHGRHATRSGPEPVAP